MAKSENLQNRRFGKWMVLEKDTYSNTHPKWICRCDCGKQCSVREEALKAGRSTKCRLCGSGKNGRSAYDNSADLSGQHFGDWTVLGRGSRDKARRSRWLCKCKCGTAKPVITR